jgi:DNA-directed RNA polymerase subunit H (RpoH/RPB5)
MFVLVLCHFLQEDGSLRPEFRVRLKRDAKLFDVYPVTIVVNGGRTKNTPRSQANAAHDYLRELKVPEHAILWTEEGHDTMEELVLAQKVMMELGLKDPIVVSNWMQLLQVRVVFWRKRILWTPSYTRQYDKSVLYCLQRAVAVMLAVVDPDGKGPIFRLLRNGRENLWGQKI